MSDASIYNSSRSPSHPLTDLLAAPFSENHRRTLRALVSERAPFSERRYSACPIDPLDWNHILGGVTFELLTEKLGVAASERSDSDESYDPADN